ncbi:MAG: BREX system P-loop protein BrxC [Succinivibrionaceae bacterium]|nr:BREX system P-loop protein BrxC [Succinivibrionaceae bacterium]
MIIKQMFQEDINRKINGVVKVDQNAKDVLVQELNEYVITRELKKHFTTFFNNYLDSFNEKTADIGVWISGFFGSGKSHFLKMLSYLLENEEIDGIKSVERFRKKFDEDPGTFMLIDEATKNKTDTILFNIDIEGSINKDKTAVLRVFAKMFYNFLGFYGEDLKVAKLEQFVSTQGKTEEFYRVFEEKNGAPWLESRDSYAFFEDDVVATLQEVLGMSEQAARNWFNGTEAVETSIAQLVSEIKDYVNTQPDNYRLLFMVDEVGQYVGGDTDLLINLQSLVEKIGSECNGKVWVVCTGQEAIDEIIKARENEFSRIQARFKTRLSLSSSSAGEVIQKRILLKTNDAKSELQKVYDNNDSVLRNLFIFVDAVGDIKGYNGPEDFTQNFPFVPYQFILLQKVFAEIRKHGNSGKHLSGGERSMLSGFQEAAQKIENKDEFALAPFYLFYDTVHTFLDSAIRRVIERAERAAADGNGLEAQDVDVLKLLYLIRYVDDVKANIDNIVILMADDIRLDKINMRVMVRESLDRLMKQNYIGRVGETYNFLTDEEQDIQREIKNTPIATADIVGYIAQKIFADIYTTKKYRHGKYDFPFDQMVDSTVVGGQLTGGMKLRILTMAADANEKNELYLLSAPQDQAVIVLAENSYFESIENAMKIRKFIKQKNVSQLAKSVQDIIRNQQAEAGKYEETATEELKKAIIEGIFYASGEHLEIKSGDAKSKIDQVLEYLVSHVYSDLVRINKNIESDAEILTILNGSNNIDGMEYNRDAATKVEQYLEIQKKKNFTTTMSDIQSRYQAVPYGWKELDIAAVVALLIHDQKVTVRYGGTTIQPDNPKLIDMLRKKSETGKTTIEIRMAISVQKIREVREFLRDYFDEMDVPEDEDGLIAYISNKFSDEKSHYEGLIRLYSGHSYPDKNLVEHAVTLTKNVISQQKDNVALIDYLIKQQDCLYSMKDSLQDIEEFFKTQVDLFDSAVAYAGKVSVDQEYLDKDESAGENLNQIKLITKVTEGERFNYRRIPELNGLISKVKEVHEKMLDEKRKEIIETVVNECLNAINEAVSGKDELLCNTVVDKAETYFSQKKQQIASTNGLTLLDGLIPQMWQYENNALNTIESCLKSKEVTPQITEPTEQPSIAPSPKKKVIKTVSRMTLFPGKTLESVEDIDNYIEKIRSNMKRLLNDCDGIKLN